jgi:hypothetical protein
MGYKFNPFTRQLDSTADASVIEQSITNSTTINNIIDGSGWQLPGPYVNEAGAAAGGVAIGQAYYDNGGTVRVRLT